MLDEQGRLQIAAERGGTINEITSFLADLESAYIALLQIDRHSSRLHALRGRHRLDFYLGIEYPLAPIGLSWDATLEPQDVLPRDRLVVNRVRIESPGFWEFLGALNPLQQIREYLNDRHKRRQDIKYREAAEEQKLALKMS